SETPSVASQKDIDEAITTASKETEKENVEEEKDITDALLNQDTKDEISEPTLKTPSKVGENKDYKLGASIDDANLFGDDEQDEGMDLDYRKDLDKMKSKITGSKLFQEVKEKITPESNDIPEIDEAQEEFIRNVNEYDEYEPIINETHIDIEATYDEYHDERLRQENTRRVFNQAKRSPELAKPKVAEIKDKPARDNIKITLNNNEVVLKKGDEIIFNHDGETYSSQVYAINGDDISVKYRRKNIKIKPNDVKKIY
ncbi:MAG: ATPase, partial [Methanobrevibacter sp.]|nr:ATPase [Methanobrevibacter sp.]